MWVATFALVLLVLGETHLSSAITASFFGSSYISVPLQDSRSTTELVLRFRTKRPDALLFLAAGRTDYFLVRLEAGKLKVHVNLGAGESEIKLAKGLRLDDLSWHEVFITRKDADMTVQVDMIHVTREELPGRFYELNIHYGLFVGGQGDFSEIFLGHLDNVRGCMADVHFNGINVLARARERIGGVEVHGVTWSCAEEFNAGYERDISFVEEDAFVALPNTITRTGARWQFDLKTGSKRGILLYNTGLTSRSDYMGVELEGGKLRLLLDKGDGPAELRSDSVVSDGRWHRVVVHFNPTYLEISVDGKTASMRLSLSGKQYLDLGDYVFLGGIEINKRARATAQSFRAAEDSLKGCMRNIEIDGKKTGIPEAKVTLGILPDCVWDFPCAKEEPCVGGARCYQHGVDSFRCECEQALCVKPDYVSGYKIFSKGSLPVDLEIVSLNTLSVNEGEHALLTPANLDVVLDYPKFGVRDSGVIFRVVVEPKHGSVQVEQARPRGETQVFTLLDLSKDKVRYVHDGNENHLDLIELELELNPGAGFTLPGYLQGRHRFVLPVNVTAVDDRPLLAIPSGKVLKLAQETKKVIPSDFLQTVDPDTPSSELVYTIVNINSQSHIELRRNPGQGIVNFSQKDVDEGNVLFVHTGDAGSSRVALQVSDGILTSPVAVLSVVAFALQLRLVNNTGLVMTHNSSTLIMPKNLAFVTNADDPESIEIKFEIVSAPQFGVLKRLRNSEWQPVQHFTSLQLAREQIRYQHTSANPTHDEFKFQASAGNSKSSTTYDFRIIFVELRLDSVHVEEITLDGVQEGTIRSTHLLYDTVPKASRSEDIVYHVAHTARFGHLILSENNSESYVQDRGTFTQHDINSGKLRYALKRRAYSRIHDEFTFRVSSKSVNNGEPGTDLITFSLVHIPGPTSDPLRVTLEPVEVSEGGQVVVSLSHLNLAMARISMMSYNLTRGPRHGRIDVLKNASSMVARHNATFFDSREIAAERVIYIHDDSETRKDSIHFLAFAPDFQYLGTLHFNVVLKNDNKPVRTIDRVFRVVKGGERILTGNDLRYEDLDIDTKPEDIFYQRRGIPNGGLYSAAEPKTPVFQFTQADLDAGRILFRHDGGEELGKVTLHINDGDSDTIGELEFRASAPYIEIANNSGLIVQKAVAAPLNPANLSIETNVNAKAEEIRYTVQEPPSHGRLELDGEESKTFTQLNVEQGNVVYKHDGGKALKDHFRFRVDAKEQAFAEGRFEFKIFPAVYWEPLSFTVNKTLHVEESTSVPLGPSVLKVEHSLIPPSDVTFIVQEEPKFGYLEIESVASSTQSSLSTEESVPSSTQVANVEVNIFDQALIDSGRLHYVQASSNATKDHIVVDVTNGIWSVQGLWLKIVVVPKHIYVQGSELSVVEGGAVALTKTHITVLTDYYITKINEFKVTKLPKAGQLLLMKEEGKASSIKKFSMKQLETGHVQYQHNGSEKLEDQFTIVARVAGTDKDSLPAVIRVTVQPLDDEKPKLVNNTGLKLYEGAVIAIKHEQLGAVDVDSPVENITFVVSAPRGGFLSLRHAPRNPIERFSQAQLLAKHVLFVHTGGLENVGFHVSLTDGVNADPGQHLVNVTVKKLQLKLVRNARLHVFPMLRQGIGAKHLLTLSSDPNPPQRHITYTIKSAPTLGRIVLETAKGRVLRVMSFSQRDVNESRVWYEHTKAFTELAANDSFLFDVTTDFADHLTAQLFNIDISVSSMTSDGLERFLKLEPIVVDEGGAASIKVNMSGVAHFLKSHSGAWTNAPAVMMLMTGAPANGEVLLQGGHLAEVGTTFSQKQLDTNHVIYQHDHSDTESDEILFSLVLQTADKEQEPILLYNGTIPVTIRPINDQPFSLRTNSPNMTVVQGQRKQLTTDDLFTVDPDTPAKEITYDIINEPKQGQLLMIYKEDRNGTIFEHSQKAGKFSQDDINHGHIFYEHSGPLQPTSFYFRVSDGHFNPIYTVFNIHVLPLNLSVKSSQAIAVPQGSSVSFITSDSIDAQTDGSRALVRYNVTSAPRHGKLYLRDVATSTFGQSDVDQRQLMYMQTDMTTSSDTFVISAWFPGTDVHSAPGQVNVTVEPLLVRSRNVNAVVGAKNRLGLDVMDASSLAVLTNSNPVYEIAKKPKLGRIKKIIRVLGHNGQGSEREKDVIRFTHEEIKSGVIYYVAKKGVDQTEDSVTLILAASIFQPAVVELKINLRHEKIDHSSSNIHSSVSPPRRGGTSLNNNRDLENVVSPNINPDYVLFFWLIIGIVALAVLIVVTVQCRNRRRRCTDKTSTAAKGKEYAFGSANGASELIDTAPTLPRPPENMLPLSPRPNRSNRFINGSIHYSDSSDSWRAVSPIPVPIPQCKVIPLDGTTLITEPNLPTSDSEADINVRYPYGAADEPKTEDWSSFDTHVELPNPKSSNLMLRRNQYWV
ncbi:chondroitin sulfate proteoglycan 4-like isoform X2 [Neocloeon triangulifer]|uniref:chondroitin sulfate proteoglycan 4-like isoform X2 n=1 Tax=Neocloeon triangulifer TaxID=2078957 RepID=UPI00286F7871|nr:chondroitin sulfate proteoglycan 4-like isoform X2 [Neocloeon triangulifer]